MTATTLLAEKVVAAAVSVADPLASAPRALEVPEQRGTQGPLALPAVPFVGGPERDGAAAGEGPPHDDPARLPAPLLCERAGEGALALLAAHAEEAGGRIEVADLAVADPAG